MRIGSIALVLVSAVGYGQSDWPTYGHDLSGTRYSPLKQIDPKNVGKLVPSWTFHLSAPAVPGKQSGGRVWETSPLVINGMMYLTAYNRVVALEPETGKEIWSYEVKDGAPATRGLEYWAGDRQAPAEIFFGTSSGKLIALNAKTGKLVPGFGVEGIVDMKPGALNGLANSSFGLSSPPVAYKNVLITGAHVQEGPSIGAAGDTRAWDVHTGKLVWQFHSVPRPGEPGSETWEGDSWKDRSGTNVWGFFTLDATRGIVYMPFGEPTSDYWGGDRKGNNLYGTSLVAADALTGKVKWYFQAVHHDTWDYDLSAPPVLFDVTRNGKKVPAVAQLTKMGLLFILNRETGEAIFGMEERPVPVADALPGDIASPTQPFPVKPPPLARNSFVREDLATVTPELEKFCQELYDSNPGGLHSGGPFTHYSTEPSVIFPSSIGGGNWNPPSYDPNLGYLFVNTQDFGSLNQMVKSADGTRYSRSGYKGNTRFWEPSGHLPCNQPPWGRLFAINVNTGDIAWQVPLGSTENLTPWFMPVRDFGTPNLGGPIVTAGNLVFVAGTMDRKLRAFDLETGRELWKHPLPAGGQATPMTYRAGQNGRQYVVIAAGGHGPLGVPRGDSVVAFALPGSRSQ